MTGEQKRRSLKWPREEKSEKEAENEEVKNAILVSGIKKTCKNVKVMGIVSKPWRVTHRFGIIGTHQCSARSCALLLQEENGDQPCLWHIVPSWGLQPLCYRAPERIVMAEGEEVPGSP